MASTLAEIEAWLGASLPASYRQFLSEHPAAWEPNDLLLLYGREEFIERNDTHEVKLYCPGFMTIGNDHGDMELMLPVVGGAVSMVDAGSLRPESFEPVAADFDAWLAAECPLPAFEHDADQWPADPLAPVVVYLERRPQALSNLLRIKEILGIQTSIAALKQCLETLPCQVASGFAYAKARVRCAEANAVDDCVGIRLAENPAIRLPV